MTEVRPTLFAMLLVAICENRPLDALVASGMSYAEIADLMSRAFNRGYIAITAERGTTVTDAGYAYLQEPSAAIRGCERWVSLDPRRCVDSDAPKPIYVPRETWSPG